MAHEWLRLWHDMPNDPKWRTISRISGQPIALVQAVYLHLLVSASRNVTRGHVNVTPEDLASALDVTDEQIEAVLNAMEGRVMADGAITGWSNRQPKKEDSGYTSLEAKTPAERKRAQRQREAEKRNVTLSHAMSREVTTDKDKDKDKSNTPLVPPLPGGNAEISSESEPEVEEGSDCVAVSAGLRRRRCRLPEGFEPNEAGMRHAVEAGIDVAAELRQFRDYHAAKGSLMADWQAAWRTWVGNARRFGAASRPAGRPVAGPAVGTDEYFELHRTAAWWRDAGFDSVWDAANSRCNHRNAHEFRDGQRVEVAA